MKKKQRTDLKRFREVCQANQEAGCTLVGVPRSGAIRLPRGNFRERVAPHRPVGQRARGSIAKMRHPSDWVIYGSDWRWYAWNGKYRIRKDLDGKTFAEAVNDFERKIGRYYETRPGNARRTK